MERNKGEDPKRVYLKRRRNGLLIRQKQSQVPRTDFWRDGIYIRFGSATNYKAGLYKNL